MEISKMKHNREDEILKLSLEFDDDMKMSLNKVWSGGNGTQWVRKACATLWHDYLWEYLEEHKLKPIKEKVDIYLEFYFSTWDSWWKRQLDSSNCSALWKIIEDSLRFHKTKNPKWILIDDTNEQVGWFCLHSVQMSLSERKALDISRVEVSIRSHNPNR